MNILFKIILGMCVTVSMVGCTTSRSFIQLPAHSTVVVAETNLKKTAIINTIQDSRVFEEKPAMANIPSLKYGLKNATPELKAKAIGRKRATFGQALGDFILRDKTVSQVVEQRVHSALNQAGYRVIKANEHEQADIVVDVNITKLWAWMHPNYVAPTINSDIETYTVITSNKTDTRTFRTFIKYSAVYGLGDDKRWIRIISDSLDDYEQRLADQLK
jgi:hypothetical protein